jgi:cytoskeletal protein RodZ
MVALVTGPRDSGPARADRSPSRRTWWIVAAVVVLIAVIIALVVGNQARTTGSPTSSPTASSSSPAAAASPSATPSGTPAAPPEPAPSASITAGIDDAVTVPAGLTIQLTGLEAVAGEAQGPGEVAGPALRATVTIANGTSDTVSLSNTVLNLYYGDAQTPADLLSGPGASAFPSEVEKGGTATGVVVFNVPADERQRVQVSVDYAAGSPVVVFEGSAPAA